MPTSKKTSKKPAQKRLIRPKEGRVVGGVALAFANYFNIDITWMRLIWLFLLLPGGLPGLLPYAICWLVIPEEK
jgi:phage shock protein C